MHERAECLPQRAAPDPELLDEGLLRRDSRSYRPSTCLNVRAETVHELRGQACRPPRCTDGFHGDSIQTNIRHLNIRSCRSRDRFSCGTVLPAPPSPSGLLESPRGAASRPVVDLIRRRPLGSTADQQALLHTRSPAPDGRPQHLPRTGLRLKRRGCPGLRRGTLATWTASIWATPAGGPVPPVPLDRRRAQGRRPVRVTCQWLIVPVPIGGRSHPEAAARRTRRLDLDASVKVLASPPC